MKNKIVKVDDLVEICKNLKADGKVVASTGGCFDILHAGHVDYLENAKKYGDVLILFLNSDKSVRGLKGPERPIVPENERAQVVAGLGCIDYVCIFDEDTPCKMIETVQPNIFVKGADYEGIDIPEKSLMESFGGEVKYVKFVDGCSSTNIIEKIKRMGK